MFPRRNQKLGNQPIAGMWMETSHSRSVPSLFSLHAIRSFLWQCIFWFLLFGAFAMYYGRLVSTPLSFHDAVNRDIRELSITLDSHKSDLEQRLAAFRLPSRDR